MASSQVINIESESCPKIEDIIEIADGKVKVNLAGSVEENLSNARRTYIKEAEEKWIYGYCTGLGELQHQGYKCDSSLEETILREHDSTIGPYTNPLIVRTAMIIRLLQMARGGAPVRPIIARRLVEAINRDITPLVPLYGSVGASGDLAPFSRIARCIFLGEGEALYQGKRVSCIEALENEKLDTITLEPGESLAFINNTAWSTAMGIVYLSSIKSLVNVLLDELGLILSKIKCNNEHFSYETYNKKNYDEIREVLDRLSRAMRCSRQERQDPYSIRCIPIVLSSTIRVIRRVEDTLMREACSSVENPVVTPKGVRHGCLFYTYPVGLDLDYLSIAVAYLIQHVERVIAQLMRKEVNSLSEYMAHGGSSVGAMMLQYTAASLAAEARRISGPSTVNSIPTSGLQEDINPMTPDAGVKIARLATILFNEVVILRALLDSMEKGWSLDAREALDKAFDMFKHVQPWSLTL